MDAASVVQLRSRGESRARVLEISAHLRAAVDDGDDARIARLLAELVRIKGLTRGQRTALQLRVVQNLVTVLRSSIMHDELTGLCNRRGFVTCGTRILDLAARDKRPYRLFYFQLEHLRPVTHAATHTIMARQMGNALRDLFPSYGVHEALGRLSANEFAALTSCAAPPGRDSMLRFIRSVPAANVLAAVRLSIGAARFDPLEPVVIDELLEAAALDLRAHDRPPRIASPVLAPQPGMTHC